MPRAILTVHNKRELLGLARVLATKVQILSGGNTGKLLTDNGIDHRPYEPAVVLPEADGRRFRWVQPNIIAGIMADRGNPRHFDSLAARMLAPVDFVVCNLRPPDSNGGDVGGAGLIGSGADNWRYVTVLVRPEQYSDVQAELEETGHTSEALRQRLAGEAHLYLADYSQSCFTALNAVRE